MQIDLIPTILLTIFAIAGLSFVVLHWRYHPKQTQLDSFDSLKKRLGRGKPALIQFHAPFWTACLAADSIVNGIEAQMGNMVEIIRLDLLGAIGRQAAREYGVYIVPATLLFDGKGELIDRQTGMPEAKKVIEIIKLTGMSDSPL